MPFEKNKKKNKNHSHSKNSNIVIAFYNTLHQHVEWMHIDTKCNMQPTKTTSAFCGSKCVGYIKKFSYIFILKLCWNMRGRIFNLSRSISNTYLISYMVVFSHIVKILFETLHNYIYIYIKCVGKISYRTACTCKQFCMLTFIDSYFFLE